MAFRRRRAKSGSRARTRERLRFVSIGVSQVRGGNSHILPKMGRIASRMSDYCRNFGAETQHLRRGGLCLLPLAKRRGLW